MEREDPERMHRAEIGVVYHLSKAVSSLGGGKDSTWLIERSRGRRADKTGGQLLL